MVTLPLYFLFIEKSKLGGTPENKVSKKKDYGTTLQFVVVSKLLKTRGRGMQKYWQTEVFLGLLLGNWGNT